MTQQQYDANDVLMGGGGAPTLKFGRDMIGVEQGGRIVEPPQAKQEREFDPDNPGGGELKFFPSGDPIMGVVVTVQTSQRTSSDDDGKRRMFIEGKRLKETVRDHLKPTGARLEVGGELYLTFTGVEGDINDRLAPKNWIARYVPATAASVDAALGTNAPAAPGVANPTNAEMLDAWAGNSTATAPPSATLPQAQPAVQRPAGIPEAAWNGMTDEAKAAVANLTPQG